MLGGFGGFPPVGNVGLGRIRGESPPQQCLLHVGTRDIQRCGGALTLAKEPGNDVRQPRERGEHMDHGMLWRGGWAMFAIGVFAALTVAADEGGTPDTIVSMVGVFAAVTAAAGIGMLFVALAVKRAG